MRFDIERLSQLAGVGAGDKKTLTEASNRSYHDSVASDTSEDRFGKNQLSEMVEEEEEAMEEGDGPDDMEELHHGMEEGEHGMDEEDVVLEIDEGMLRKEILRMKKERLEEARLRGAIRNEIRDIFASLTNDSSWMYGDDKPTLSKDGQVTRGFLGIGFKK